MVTRRNSNISYGRTPFVDRALKYAAGLQSPPARTRCLDAREPLSLAGAGRFCERWTGIQPATDCEPRLSARALKYAAGLQSPPARTAHADTLAYPIAPSQNPFALSVHPLILSLPQPHRGSSFLDVVSRNEGPHRGAVEGCIQVWLFLIRAYCRGRSTFAPPSVPATHEPAWAAVRAGGAQQFQPRATPWETDTAAHQLIVLSGTRGFSLPTGSAA